MRLVKGIIILTQHPDIPMIGPFEISNSSQGIVYSLFEGFKRQINESGRHGHEQVCKRKDTIHQFFGLLSNVYGFNKFSYLCNFLC